jgi:hypothetical protein
MSLLSQVKRSFALAALALTLVLTSAFLWSSKVGSTSVNKVGSAPVNKVGSTSVLLCNPTYSTWVTYYSDASYTVEIGHRYIHCNGTGTLVGSSSSYQQSEIIDVCCRDPGGNSCVPC